MIFEQQILPTYEQIFVVKGELLPYESFLKKPPTIIRKHTQDSKYDIPTSQKYEHV